MSSEQPVFAPGLKPTLEPVVSKLEKFIIYETTSFLYVVGCDKRQIEYRVLKLDRRAVQPSRLDEILLEDDCVYSREELKDMLEMIHEGNKAQGGLVRLQTGFGILGFVKFLDCYYLLLITQRRKVGSIGGNTIYGIKATEMVPIKPAKEASTQSWGKQMVGAVNRRLNPTQHEIAEQRYLGLFQFIDLTKDFYFSYTYDLTQPLQFNMAASTRRAFPPPSCKDMYAWNHYLTSEFEATVGSLNATHWRLPLVHGAFLQRKCTLFGRLVNLTLIARRSRHFAGTRYLKRGVSDLGKCANDVEMEQIVHEEGVGEGTFSSFLQVRGSIPTFWAQETSVTMPKPPIVLNRIDPTYAASQLHFVDLLERYSAPVLVLDLTKHAEKREREIIVSSEYKTAIECLNSSMTSEDSGGGIQYCALDFNHLSKQRHGPNVLSSLRQVACWSTAQTGLFVSAPRFQVDATTGKVLGPALPASRSVAAASMAEATKSSAGADTSTSNAAKTAASDAASAISAPPQPSDSSSSTPSSSKPTPQGKEQSRGLPAAMEQRGVLRTNCIDCLDRTNVAQFSVGAHALGLQLAAMGLVNHASLEGDSPAVLVLMDIYSTVGDQIALQYGGSEAHKKVAAGAGQVASAGPNGVGNALNLAGKASGSGGKHKELLTSIRRYYSNAFTDRLKQDAMNVFLGHYVVCEHDVALWDLENDYYLHNFHVQRGVELTMSQFKEPWEDAEEEERLRKARKGEHNEDPGSPDSDLSSPNSAASSAAAAAAEALASKRALAQAAAADAAAGAAYYHEAAVAARTAARAAALEEHQAKVRAARQAEMGQDERADELRSAYHNESDGAYDDAQRVAQSLARAEEEKEKEAAAVAAAAARAAQAAAEAEAAEARATLEAEKAEAARAAELAAIAEAAQVEVPEKGVKKKKKSFMKALSRPFGKKSKQKNKQAPGEVAGEEGKQEQDPGASTTTATADVSSSAAVKATTEEDADDNNEQGNDNDSEGSGVDEARRSFDSDGSDFDESEPWSPSSSSSSSSPYQVQDRPKSRPRLSQEQVVRVRLRCNAQQRAIEQWWRDAQAKHDMNRLWMRLGQQQSSFNPTAAAAATTTAVAQPGPQQQQQQRWIGDSGRFDRVFRPDKITQFDKLLSYDFNSPVPLHANQEVSHRSRGGFPGFPGGRRGPRRVGSGNQGGGGEDGDGGLGGGGGDEGPLLAGDLSAANAVNATATHLPLEPGGPRHASFRDAEADDDEEGPDRAVAIGKLVRDLFLINRAHPRALGAHSQGAGEAPSNGSHSGSGSSSSGRHKHSSATGGRSILLDGQLSSGQHNADKSRSSGSILGGSTKDASTSASGLAEAAQSRVEVSVTSSFVGTLGTHALGSAAQRESRRFGAISEFAQQPENYFGGTLHAEARSQFEVALWETSLPDDAVAGNRASSDLSHCARRLKHGPFKGCRRDTRAAGVVLATEEPLAVLTHPWAKARGHLPTYDYPVSSINASSSSSSSSPTEAVPATSTTATADATSENQPPKHEASGEASGAANRTKASDETTATNAGNKATDRKHTSTSPLPSSLESTPPSAARAVGGSDALPSVETVPLPTPGETSGSQNQSGQRAATALAGLASQGLNCEGVLGQIKHGLASAQTADQVYEAALDSETQAAARTALTDASTFTLYTSFFQDETLAADQSLDFMLRSPAPPKPQTYHPVLTSSRKLVAAWPYDDTERADGTFNSTGSTSATSTPEEAAAAAATAAGAAAGAAAAASVAAASSNSNSSSGSSSGSNTGGAAGAWLDEVHLLPDLSTSLSEYGAYEAQIAAAEAAVAAARATSSATARARAAADRDALEVAVEPSSPVFVGTYLPLNPPLPLPKHLQAAKDSAAAMRGAQRDRLVAAQLAQERKRLEARQWQPHHSTHASSSPEQGRQYPAYYSTEGPELLGALSASPGHSTAATAAIVADGATAATGGGGGPRRQPLTTASTPAASSGGSGVGSEPESPLGMPHDDLVIRKLGAHFADPSHETSAAPANTSGAKTAAGMIDPVPEEATLDYDDDEDDEDFLGYFVPPPPQKPQGSQSSPSRGGAGGGGSGAQSANALAPAPAAAGNAGVPLNSGGDTGAVGGPPTRLYYGYERAGESSNTSGDLSSGNNGAPTSSSGGTPARRGSLPFSPASMPGRRLRSTSNANSAAGMASEADQVGDGGVVVDENEDGFTRRGYMFAKADNPFVLFNAAGKQALAPKLE